MTKKIPGTDLPVCTQKGLLRRNRCGDSWRLIAADYGVNQKYVHEFAMKGIIPANLEVCYRMGLKRRPVPHEKRPLSPFRLAVLWMAEETRKAVKGWKVAR